MDRREALKLMISGTTAILGVNALNPVVEAETSLLCSKGHIFAVAKFGKQQSGVVPPKIHPICVGPDDNRVILLNAEGNMGPWEDKESSSKLNRVQMRSGMFFVRDRDALVIIHPRNFQRIVKVSGYMEFTQWRLSDHAIYPDFLCVELTDRTLVVDHDLTRPSSQAFPVTWSSDGAAIFTKPPYKD